MGLSAPGTYQTEKVCLDHSPAFSFGIKHAVDKVSNNPGKTNNNFIPILSMSFNRISFNSSIIQHLVPICRRMFVWTTFHRTFSTNRLYNRKDTLSK